MPHFLFIKWYVLRINKSTQAHQKIHSMKVYVKYVSRLSNDSESNIEVLLLGDQENNHQETF